VAYCAEEPNFFLSSDLAVKYRECYDDIQVVIRRHRTYRWHRLGSRARTPVHQLSDGEVSLIMLGDAEFNLSFVQDPRTLTAAMGAAGDSLWEPIRRRSSPSPPLRGWPTLLGSVSR